MARGPVVIGVRNRIKSLCPSPGFDISDFAENAFAFGDSYFGEVAMRQDCLSGFLLAALGSWSGAQPTMDSAAVFPPSPLGTDIGYARQR